MHASRTNALTQLNIVTEPVLAKICQMYPSDALYRPANVTNAAARGGSVARFRKSPFAPTAKAAVLNVFAMKRACARGKSNPASPDVLMTNSCALPVAITGHYPTAVTFHRIAHSAHAYNANRTNSGVPMEIASTDERVAMDDEAVRMAVMNSTAHHRWNVQT